MNSAAVRPNSRCSSVNSSRMNTSSARTAFVRNCPPVAIARVSVVIGIYRPNVFGAPIARFWRDGVVDSPAGGKYKPDNVPTLNELFSLKDRAAIVTGGSRGIGLEMAEGLAEAGAALMLCARRDEWLTPTVADMRKKGFRVEGMRCDVSKADEV